MMQDRMTLWQGHRQVYKSGPGGGGGGGGGGAWMAVLRAQRTQIFLECPRVKRARFFFSIKARVIF